jgi:hypothetical protein
MLAKYDYSLQREKMRTRTSIDLIILVGRLYMNKMLIRREES